MGSAGSSYLDTFGAADARRERLVKRILMAILLAAVVGLALWLYMKNYYEDRQLANFVDLLKKKDYAAAYKLWGCSVEQPCRDYDFARFNEDWGPKQSTHPAEAVQIVKVKNCEGGVLRALQFPKDEVVLIVNRADKTIGYAPFGKQCAPTLKVPVNP
jgi:hypothetical protein